MEKLAEFQPKLAEKMEKLAEFRPKSAGKIQKLAESPNTPQ